MHQVYEPICRGLHASPPPARKPAAPTIADLSRWHELAARKRARADRLGESIANALAAGVVGVAVAWILVALAH